MLESSPPLMTKELFVEHVTHKTGAIWDLCKRSIYTKLNTLNDINLKLPNTKFH